MNSSGLTLLETLIAATVLCILALVSSTAFVRMRQGMAIDKSHAEAENLRAYVQGLINQRGVCSNALRTGTVLGGTPIVWDPIGSPGSLGTVGHIEVNDGIIPAALAIAPGRYGTFLNITKIFLTEPTLAEGHTAHGVTVQNGLNYDLVSAKLVLDVTGTGSITFFQEIKADLVVGIDSVAHTVDFCGSSQSMIAPNSFLCGALTQNHGAACVNPNPLYCSTNYDISGFDANGVPLCDCTISCFTGPQGIHVKGGH